MPAGAGGAGDRGAVPGSGRSPGAGNGNPLPDSCLENSVDRRPWRASVRGVTKSRVLLSAHTQGYKRQCDGHLYRQTLGHF